MPPETTARAGPPTVKQIVTLLLRFLLDPNPKVAQVQANLKLLATVSAKADELIETKAYEVCKNIRRRFGYHPGISATVAEMKRLWKTKMLKTLTTKQLALARSKQEVFYSDFHQTILGGSTDWLHVDAGENVVARGVYNFVGSTFVVSEHQPRGPSAAVCTRLDPAALIENLDGLKLVEAPAGSILFFGKDRVHANAKPGHLIPSMDIAPVTIPYAEAIAPGAANKLLSLVRQCGVAVVTGVWSFDKCAEIVHRKVRHIQSIQQDPGNDPKGPSDNLTWTHYGISTIEPDVDLASNALNVWANVCGVATTDLIFSPDSWVIASTPGDVTDVYRVARKMTMGKRSDQQAGVGGKKIAHYARGGVCTHDPTKFIPGGKGSHPLNTGDPEKRWKTFLRLPLPFDVAIHLGP